MNLSENKDFIKMFQIKDEFVKKIWDDIIAVKPDIIFTEK